MQKPKTTSLTFRDLSKRANFVSRAEKTHQGLVEGIRKLMLKGDETKIETNMRDLGLNTQEREDVKSFILNKKEEVLGEMENYARIENDPLIKIIRSKPRKERLLALAALTSHFSFLADVIYEKYMDSSKVTLPLRLLAHNHPIRLTTFSIAMSAITAIATNDPAIGLMMFSFSLIMNPIFAIKYYKDILKLRSEARAKMIPENFKREVFDQMMEDESTQKLLAPRDEIPEE